MDQFALVPPVVARRLFKITRLKDSGAAAHGRASGQGTATVRVRTLGALTFHPVERKLVAFLGHTSFGCDDGGLPTLIGDILTLALVVVPVDRPLRLGYPQLLPRKVAPLHSIECERLLVLGFPLLGVLPIKFTLLPLARTPCNLRGHGLYGRHRSRGRGGRKRNHRPWAKVPVGTRLVVPSLRQGRWLCRLSLGLRVHIRGARGARDSLKALAAIRALAPEHLCIDD